MKRQFIFALSLLVLASLACGLPAAKSVTTPEPVQERDPIGTVQALQATVASMGTPAAPGGGAEPGARLTAMATLVSVIGDVSATQAAIATTVVGGATGGGMEVAPTDVLPLPAYTPSPDTHAIGERVDYGEITWIVLGWNVVQDPFMPKTLVVDLLTINRSSSPVYIANSFTSKDVQGQDSYAAGAENLSAGERARVSMQFFIEGQPSLLVLNPDDYYGYPASRIIWDLGPNPAAVAAPAPLEGERQPVIYKVGDVVQLGSLTIQATGVTFPPPDSLSSLGCKYVAIDLVFQNQGTQDVEINSDYAIWLKDADGFYYGSYFSMPNSTIFPGGQMVTQAKIEAPVNARGLMLVFDGGYMGLDKIFIALE